MQFDIFFLDTFLGLPCWLLWLLASLLSGLLGYLLGWARFNPIRDQLAAALGENKRLHAGITDWEVKYRELQYLRDELEKDVTALRASLNQCEADKAALSSRISSVTDAATAFSAPVSGGPDFGGLVGRDNLQIIEGIGPKIEQLLKNAGISTWAAVAGASYDDLKQVLDDAGPRYRMHDPKSWPEQARLAVEGKWDELIRYQKFLDAGREDQGDFVTDSKLEKLLVKKLNFSLDPKDLKVVEGIGPEIESVLKEAGIQTWPDLADSTAERLKGILSAAGDQFHLADPETWPNQASLAAAGRWVELKVYQDQLTGGKE